MANERQGPGACVSIVGGFGNPHGPTVQWGAPLVLYLSMSLTKIEVGDSDENDLYCLCRFDPVMSLQNPWLFTTKAGPGGLRLDSRRVRFSIRPNGAWDVVLTKRKVESIL
jgi:hypothetical protein